MNQLRTALSQTTGEAERIGATVEEDPWRLKLHLMPPVGWLNDPNGLSYYMGEYHVFYQYGPYDPMGAIKFWGHYKSPDMLTWEMCSPMLYSDEPFDVHGAYSGSAIQGSEGLMMLYTGNVKHDDKDYDYVLAGREQNTVLAVSRDGVNLDRKTLLMTNSDYPEDMSLHVRDPKVLSYEDKYYMVLGGRTKQDVGVALVYESDDLYSWKHINTLKTKTPQGYMWECPDLFEIDGKWFLMASPQGLHDPHKPGHMNENISGYFPIKGDFRSEYELGDFVPLDYGFDFYAPQTFWLPSGENSDKRKLLVAWLGGPEVFKNPTVKYGWQHCLSQVREVTCTEDGRLAMTPIRELNSLRGTAEEFTFSSTYEREIPDAADLLIQCADKLRLELSGLEIEVSQGILRMRFSEGGYGREMRSAHVPNFRGLRILVDTSALEIFTEDGLVVLSTRWYPDPDEPRTLTLEGEGSAVLYPMDPLTVWQSFEERVSRRLESEVLT